MSQEFKDADEQIFEDLYFRVVAGLFSPSPCPEVRSIGSR